MHTEYIRVGNYTRVMNRPWKMYYAWLPFPIPVIEGAVAVAVFYVFWNFITPHIPFFSGGVLRIIISIAVSAGGVYLAQTKTMDERTPIFLARTFLEYRTRPRISSTLRKGSASRAPFLSSGRDITVG